MTILKNEKGYSLLLTLMLVLLFSILGASLIAMTFNGVAKNETREEIVQSSDLATKGIERITSQITNELNSSIGTKMLAVDYIKELNRILESYSCGNGTSLEGAASENAGTSYSTCIYKVKNDINSGISVNSTIEYLRKVITFKSEGKSGEKIETLYSTYNIGSTQYPEVLNYAVGAYKVTSSDIDRFPSLPGEGNLYLNGGVSIQGDIKVDNDLILSNRGIWKSGSNAISEESQFPQLSGYSQSDKSKLFLGGKLLHFTYPSRIKEQWSNTFTYENYINGYFTQNTSYYSNYSNEKKLFFNEVTPTRVDRFVEIEPIDFAAKQQKLFFPSNTSNSYVGSNNKVFNNLSINTNLYLATSTTEKINSSCKRNCDMKTVYSYNEDFMLSGTNSFGSVSNRITGKFATTGNLTINGPSTTFHNGGYVGGNLNISGKTAIKGTVYVKDNLTISEADLESDVIFYVDGNVSITESEIAGITYTDNGNYPEKNRTGSLIIFAKGNIQLSNNSEYESAPSDFKAYFYSEKTMEMYGVGSNIKINGGISARKIILNAVRGDTSREISCYFFCYYTGKLKIDSLTNQKNKSSRLQIIYDPEIIKTFSELDVETEPWINNISPPIELERTYKSP